MTLAFFVIGVNFKLTGVSEIVALCHSSSIQSVSILGIAINFLMRFPLFQRPGEYFLRPILQEYQFDPKFLTVNINEGEFETVNLKGRRFAYRYPKIVVHFTTKNFF